jgi:VCBS repeat-containing protein
MVLEFNGDITLAGCIYETDVHFALVRFDSSGQQLAIGADGDLTFAFGGFACAQALAKDPVTSDYYLAGYDFTPAGDEQFAVARVKGNNQNNQPPTAVPDTYSAASGASLILSSPGILENDSDPDGPALLAVLVEGPANGILYLNPNGQFRYSSTLGFTGQDSFTYQASDGYTHSTPTTVTIQVEPNSPPLPADDTYLALEDTPLMVVPPGVLGNDNEPDGEPVTIVFEDLPENGSFLFNQDGAFIYTPDPGFSGTESFTYYLRDTVGHESGSATVTINVLPAGSNLPPDALPDSYSTLQNTPLTITAPGVLDNDSDPNGDPLTAELQSEPAHGSLALNADGSFLYTPNQTFSGQDSFSYRAGDGITHSVPTTVTIQVEPNSPPIATGDTYQALENIPLTVAAPGILGNDHEPDGEPVTVVFETSPENGTFQFNQDGAFTYTPDPGFSGTESFTYYLHDTAGNESNTATITINVQPAGSNVPPIAVSDSYGTPQNTPLTVAAPGVLDNDSDLNGDPLTAVLENGPDQGSLTLNPDGSFLYTPNQDFSGQDSFSYRANDGSASSTPVSVTITVSTLPDGGSRLYLPLVIR